MTAVDFSFARFTVAQLKAAGVNAVVRYLTGPGKAISGEELAADLFGGLQVALAFENQATDANGGYQTGAVYAAQANAALTALSLPVSTPVYFAADTDYPNPAAAVPYYQGIASVRPGAANGCYGEAKLIDLCLQAGYVHYGWESESSSFPGNGALDPNVALWQRWSGAPLNGTDLDDIEKADWGQLPRPTPQPVKVPIVLNIKITGNIADILESPDGGCWVLGTDGGVSTAHLTPNGPEAPFRGSAAGQAYFAGRTAAQLVPYTDPHGVHGYTIIDTAGEKYSYPTS